MAVRRRLAARFRSFRTISAVCSKCKFTVGEVLRNGGEFLSRPRVRACRVAGGLFSDGYQLREGLTKWRDSSSLGVEELSWQKFFSDPTQWLDNRRSKETTEHPDFRHTKSTEALWLSNSSKPDWVDSQLAMLDAQVDAGIRGPPAFAPTSVLRASGRLAAHEVDLQVGTCRKLCENGQVNEAVDALSLLVQRGCHIPNNLFYCVLRRCFSQKDLALGRRIHALSVESGYEENAFLANQLIGLYASHRWLEEAMRVFSKVSKPDVYMWASIIRAYARQGESKQAIALYRQMRETTVKPGNHVFVAVLKACASGKHLQVGKEVHAHIDASAVKPDLFVQTCLVDMYAKCGSLEDASRVFDSLSQKDVVTWTAMIAGYAQQGMGHEALSLYHRMQNEGIVPPDSVTFVSLLQACASIGVAALHQGKQLHLQIDDRRLQDDMVVGNSLINMYSKCGSLEDACRVFDRLPQRGVVTWTAMIAAYAQHGMGQEALRLYSSMQQEGITPPNSVTFVCLLQACASVGALHQGKQLHAQIEERGLLADMVVGNSLVNMYAKCGSPEAAQKLFDGLSQKDVVTWNAMIAGYAHQGMALEALSLYRSMQQGGMALPNSVTFVCLLQACASVGVAALKQGMQLHLQIEEREVQPDVVVGNSLVNMYFKCGSLEDARRVFDRLMHKDVVTWNTMVAGYTHQGKGQEAISLYSSMQQEGITLPDSVTFVCLLQACASLGVAALHQGKVLHAQIQEHGHQDDAVVGNSLVNMYAKCGSLEDARSMFDRLRHRDVVTWTAMIAGYAQQGMGQEALGLFRSMQEEGITPPDSVTFVCLLQACASVAALPLGKQLHAQIHERGLQTDVVVGPSLVNMYAKCGSLEDAQQVFDSLPEKDIVAWGALIAGHTRQGDSEVVFDLVRRMRQDGIEPNAITFLSLLTLCSHAGLVDKGRKYFEAMIADYCIDPTIEHYTCIVDLLGRAGKLDEALMTVKTMPFQPDGPVCLTLLGACRTWGNVEVGRQAFEFAVKLDEKDSAAYILMSNIYAGAEMLEEAKVMQARRVRCEAWKEPGQSWWTDMEGVVHSFVVRDRKRPDIEGVSNAGTVVFRAT